MTVWPMVLEEIIFEGPSPQELASFIPKGLALGAEIYSGKEFTPSALVPTSVLTHHSKGNPGPKKRRRIGMKRRRVGDHLTGGTKDVNPQFISGIVTMETEDTIHNATITVPKLLGQALGSSRASLMEILKVQVEVGARPILEESPVPKVYSQYIAFATRPMTTTSVAGSYLANPSVFCKFADITHKNMTAVPVGFFWETYERIKEKDLTDKAGHGWLIAVDQIHVQCDTEGYNGPSAWSYKIWYRFKIVGLIEYIGIVQSQS